MLKISTLLTHFDEYTKKVARGFIPLDAGKRLKFTIEKLGNIEEELIAVGYNDIDSWWTGSAGNDYFEKNRKILESGKKIRRIYIVSEREKSNANFSQWYKKQLSLFEPQQGSRKDFNLFLVDAAILLAENPELAVSFLIFDNEFITVSKYLTGISSEKIGGISFDKDDVEKYKTYFENLKKYTMNDEEIKNLGLPLNGGTQTLNNP